MAHHVMNISGEELLVELERLDNIQLNSDGLSFNDIYENCDIGFSKLHRLLRLGVKEGMVEVSKKAVINRVGDKSIIPVYKLKKKKKKK